MNESGRRATNRRRQPPALRRRMLDALFVVILLALAMVPLWSIYQHPAIITLCAVGLGAGAGIALAGAALRLPGYAVISITALVYVLIGVPLAVPGKAVSGILPSIDGLRELLFGTATAWQQMLTVRIPLGDYQALLVPALVVVLVSSVAGVSIALRAARPGWAIVLPLAVLIVGIAFGSSVAFLPLAAGIAFLVAAIAWAAVGIGDARSSSHTLGHSSPFSLAKLRRFAAAALVVAVCGGAAIAIVGAVSPPGARQVLRTSVVPPFDPRDYVSPLVGYRNEVLPPGSKKTLFTIDGLPEDARIRLATLDTYNGIVFSVGSGSAASSGSFERVPYKVDRGDAGSAKTAKITVKVGSYKDVWLPTVGDLVSLSFDGEHSSLRDSFFFNMNTGTGAVVDGLTPGASYALETVVSGQPTEDDLRDAKPGTTDQPDAQGVPQELIDAAQEHSGTSDAPGEQLIALAEWLRSGYISHSGKDEPFSRSGHSADRLRALVTELPMLGDAEQYATAMALLAREVGFPSRVVLGYAPDAGHAEITGADTTAWVEVQLADGSWATVDPNPEVRDVPKDDKVTTDYIAHPKTVLPPPSTTEDDSVSSQSNDNDKDPEEEVPAWLTITLAVLRIAGVVLGILAIVTAPFWVIALILAIRRMRRRQRDRQHRVVTGAWNEIRDSLIDQGHPVAVAATRSEISEISGSERVRVLAARADHSVFSGDVLGSGDVDGFWGEIRGTRRELRKGLGFKKRLRAALSLRSIRASVVAKRAKQQP